MALSEYARKRDFKKTAEPKPRVAKGASALRFCVQKHRASHLHYDFRLELDGVMKSWAVPKGPSLNPKDKRLAMMVEDHPVSYMTFEGEIPKGQYGAGQVIVWDIGLYSSAETADPALARRKLKSGLRRGDLKFVLAGKKLKGAFALVRIKNQKDERGNAWLLIKEKDEFAKAVDVTKKNASALSRKRL